MSSVIGATQTAALRERAPCLPSGATRSCVHISSRAVTHSRGERVLSWGQHLCSPAKKARPTLGGQAAVQHSSALCRIHKRARRGRARRSAEAEPSTEFSQYVSLRRVRDKSTAVNNSHLGPFLWCVCPRKELKTYRVCTLSFAMALVSVNRPPTD